LETRGALTAQIEETVSTERYRSKCSLAPRRATGDEDVKRMVKDQVERVQHVEITVCDFHGNFQDH
jgi:hypothetical protein